MKINAFTSQPPLIISLLKQSLVQTKTILLLIFMVVAVARDTEKTIMPGNWRPCLYES